MIFIRNLKQNQSKMKYCLQKIRSGNAFMYKNYRGLICLKRRVHYVCMIIFQNFS